MRDKILTSYLQGFSEDFGYQNADESKLFELFAAYFVVCHAYTDRFDVENSIVGDGGDTGIDAIVIIINGRAFNDINELKSYIDGNEKIDVQFIFVQSKISHSFDSKDVLSFGAGVMDFFRDESELVCNDSICRFRDMKDIVYTNARKFYNGKQPKRIMYYVATGEYVEDKNLVAAKNKAISDVSRGVGEKNVSFEYVDAKRLYKMYQEVTRGTAKEIKMGDYIALPESDNVDEALLGMISCDQYIKLICDDDGMFNKNIFSDNIRDYLGDSTVNKEIASTITNSSQREYFILLNNGITAVAKRVQRVKNKLYIDNIQIVNGCQTSNVLYENRKLLTSNMYIPIKIISTTNQDIINSIIISTNRQNRVEQEAFESLSEFHRKFEIFCPAMNRYAKDNIYYERRSRQYVTNEAVKPIEIVTLSNLLYATISMYIEEPHSTHRYYGELLKANKGKVFIGSHNLEPYYFFAYCLKKITAELRRDYESKKHFVARYYALMYLWKILTKNKKYYLNSREISEKIAKEFLHVVDDRDIFTEICAEGIDMFYTIVKSSNIPPQNIARTKLITDEMLKRIALKLKTPR